MNHPRLALACMALCGIAAQTCVASDADAVQFFESRVRPILAQHCFRCHGPDKQWANFRVDSRASLLAGGESGPAIAVGKPAESLIISRVSATDEALRMPPAEEGKALSANEIAALKHWIEQGAVWPSASTVPEAERAAAQRSHWAFQPLRRPAPPSVAGHDWGATPVDQFILHKLREQQLVPSPPADRRTLIRRATYDLLGLPPTPEEVEDFVRDESPNAYEKLIDRLLMSPHYGEQWGRHWLDVARYSDTKGYVYAREERSYVHSQHYRDWVVRAFSEDMPYDRFLLLQLAADQVTPHDPSALAAMGFLTIGRRFLGVAPDIIDDRIDVVTRGAMGLTVACARCHDHKYDPIPTADYYSLYGVFQNSVETMVALPRSPGVAPPSTEYESELQTRKQKLADAIATRSTEASDRARQRIADYLFAQRELDKYPPAGFGQILTKADLIPTLVWRWQNYLTASAREADPIFTPWLAYASLKDDEFSTTAAGIAATLSTTSNAVANRRVAEVFSTPAASARDVADRYGQVFAEVDRTWKDLCQTANQNNQPQPSSLPDTDDEALRQVLYGPGSPCVIPDEPIINTERLHDSATTTELWRLQVEVDRWLLQSPEAAPHAMILVDRPNPVDPRVFRRGNPTNNATEVPRQFLAVLSPENRAPFSLGSGRLEMAQAITHRENPLTARVWVNRVWMHHFGAGLVRTPSDFGLRADPPSHPELLDWLAQEFISGGWSTKALHRQIMLSSVYQQSSRGPSNPAIAQRAEQRDPENRLLWRMNARRLSFEEFRDTLVFLTGEWDPTVGGRPVEFFPASGNRFRRSLYGRIDRQFVPSVLRVFDFANPDLHSPQRSETTIPQQALFALNHPFIAGRAQALTKELGSNSTLSLEVRISQLYQRVFQRAPSPAQISTALAFVDSAQREPAPPELPPETLAWSYGYGELDYQTERLKGFTPLPFFNGSAWQGGPKWPDSKLGWAQLTAQGGHTGNDLQHAAIRRWTAPFAAKVAVRSTLVHSVAAGDGIRGWIVSSRQGVLRQATVHNAESQLDIEELNIESGETLDFVVDYHQNLNSDQFRWAPTIEVLESSAVDAPIRVWNAERNFAGTAMTALDSWAQLAQVLLLSNELMFVD